MIIFAGIDGTGDWSNSKYSQKFADSYVNRLSRGEGLGGEQAWAYEPFYHRGPRVFGNDTFFQAIKVYNHVVGGLMEYPKARVFLSGYSRGGAAVIAAAQWMKRTGYAVDALFLFDAVDRALPVNGYTVSSNVKQVYHARRDPAAQSRQSFGNCGWARENSSKTGYEQRFFFCTHGAIGGMPWNSDSVPKDGQFIDEGLPDGLTAVTPQNDKAGADLVWTWMLSKVRREYARARPVPMSLLGRSPL